MPKMSKNRKFSKISKFSKKCKISQKRQKNENFSKKFQIFEKLLKFQQFQNFLKRSKYSKICHKFLFVIFGQLFPHVAKLMPPLVDPFKLEVDREKPKAEVLGGDVIRVFEVVLHRFFDGSGLPVAEVSAVFWLVVIVKLVHRVNSFACVEALHELGLG